MGMNLFTITDWTGKVSGHVQTASMDGPFIAQRLYEHDTQPFDTLQEAIEWINQPLIAELGIIE